MAAVKKTGFSIQEIGELALERLFEKHTSNSDLYDVLMQRRRERLKLNG